MAGKEPNENPWAEEEKEQEHDEQHQQNKPKEGKKLTEKLGEGLNKTKEGTYRSMKKVRDGASVGLFWMKDKFRKPAPQPKDPSPPPPSASP